MLSKVELGIIAEKIEPDKSETVEEAFNRMVEVRDENRNLDQQATAANVTQIINFIDRAGGRWDSPMWSQITEIKGLAGPHVVVEISDHDAFIKAAEGEGFRRIRYIDWLFSLTPWGHHRYNSIREVTPVSSAFSLHFANDHGDSVYYAHWDPTSITYLIPTWSFGIVDVICAAVLEVAEWVYRALVHGSFPTPTEVSRRLKSSAA